MTIADIVFFTELEKTNVGGRNEAIEYAAVRLAYWAREQADMSDYTQYLEQGNVGRHTDIANDRWRQVCNEMVQVFCFSISQLVPTYTRAAYNKTE